MSDVDVALGMVQLVSVVLSVWLTAVVYFVRNYDERFDWIDPWTALYYNSAILACLFFTFMHSTDTLFASVASRLQTTFFFFGAFLLLLTAPVPQLVGSVGGGAKGEWVDSQTAGKRLTQLIAATGGLFFIWAIFRIVLCHECRV